jgi:toxin-antitoxin system PIN domain toxin
MNLPDVNLWLAAILSGHSHHKEARSWLESQENTGEILLCRVTQQGVLRLLTTEAVMGCYGIAPLGNRAAWEVMEAFLADERIVFASEPPGLDKVWRSLSLRETHSPKLWMDAYLAAFALCKGARLVTTDKAFSQFEGLYLHLLNRQKKR